MLSRTLNEEQIERLLELLGPDKAAPYIAVGRFPIMGAAGEDEEDGDEEEKDEGDDEEEKDEKRPKGKGKKEEKDEEDGDEEEASDEETGKFIQDLLKLPEVTAVIRDAARTAAAASEKTVKEVRDELSKEIAERIELLTDEVTSGRITKTEAKRRARAAAEEEAQITVATSAEDEVDEDDENEREERSSRREERIRLRELNIVRKELINEDKTGRVIPELVKITAETDEDDVEDMIEESKEVYDRVRRKVITDLRNKGWKSPRDLKAEDGDEESEDDSEEEVTPGSPPSRDRKQTGTVDKKRRGELRTRFGYIKHGRRTPS